MCQSCPSRCALSSAESSCRDKAAKSWEGACVNAANLAATITMRPTFVSTALHPQRAASKFSLARHRLQSLNLSETAVVPLGALIPAPPKERALKSGSEQPTFPVGLSYQPSPPGPGIFGDEIATTRSRLHQMEWSSVCRNVAALSTKKALENG